MAEYSANAVQTVNPGESIVFTTSVDTCNRGFVKHRSDTGAFMLNGCTPSNCTPCCCNSNRNAKFYVDFGCNIAIPTGGTVGTISLVYALDGVNIPSSQMDSTPAAVETYNNVSTAITVPVWKNCCQTLTVKNISTQAILVKNANITFSRPDLNITY